MDTKRKLPAVQEHESDKKTRVFDDNALPDDTVSDTEENLPSLEDTEFIVYNHRFATFLLALFIYTGKTLNLNRAVLEKVAIFIFNTQLLAGLSSVEALFEYKRGNLFGSARSKDHSADSAYKIVHRFIEKHREPPVSTQKHFYPAVLGQFISKQHNDSSSTSSNSAILDALTKLYCKFSNTLGGVKSAHITREALYLSILAISTDTANLRNYLTMAGIDIGEKYVKSALCYVMFECLPLRSTNADCRKLFTQIYELMYQSSSAFCFSYSVVDKAAASTCERALLDRAEIINYFRKGLYINPDNNPINYRFSIQPPSISKSLAWNLEGQHNFMDNSENTGEISSFAYQCILFYLIHQAVTTGQPHCPEVEAAFESMAIYEGEVLFPVARRIQAIVKQFTFLLHLLQYLFAVPELSFTPESKKACIERYIGPFTRKYLNAYDRALKITPEAFRFLTFGLTSPVPFTKEPSGVIIITASQFEPIGNVMNHILNLTVGRPLIESYAQVLKHEELI